MGFRLSRPTPSMAVSFVALFVALGGSGYAATVLPAKGHSGHGKSNGGTSQSFQASGEKFLSAGHHMTILKVGNFKFTAVCSKVPYPGGGTENQVAFNVVSLDGHHKASLDGNPPVGAGSPQNIHTDSDSADSTSTNTLHNGDYAQTGSASDTTEIDANGKTVDAFYNDGVNGFGHDCFAEATAFQGPTH